MKAVIMYSGGKDGHLALMRALEDGAEIAGLMYLDGRGRHFDLFHESRKAAILRELARRNGYRFLPVRVSGDVKSDVFLGSLCEFVRESTGGDGTVYNGATEELPEENSLQERMSAIFRERGVKVISPLLNMTFGEVLSGVLKKKIKALVTGAIGAESYGFIGKTVDGKFARHAGRLSLDGNYFQTLVVKSPLFGTGLRIKKARPVDTADEGRYLEILDWEVV